jgi:hypothetical protein
MKTKKKIPQPILSVSAIGAALAVTVAGGIMLAAVSPRENAAPMCLAQPNRLPVCTGEPRVRLIAHPRGIPFPCHPTPTNPCTAGSSLKMGISLDREEFDPTRPDPHIPRAGGNGSVNARRAGGFPRTSPVNRTV